MLEDKILIFKLSRGNSGALCRIYEKYRHYMLKIATALLYDASAGEDVVHDVFMRLAQSAESLKIRSSLKSYLRTCVVNGVRNKVRSNEVRSYVELSKVGDIASHERSGDHYCIIKETSLEIANALRQVPFEQREVIVLHLHGDMKFREIAQLQAVTTKTIQSRYRYGLDKLRSILDSEVK